MKTLRPPIIQFHLILLIILLTAQSPAKSQSVGIQADLSSVSVASGDEITLTFSTYTAADIYFFSAEITYDPDQLEFTDAVAAGAMTPGGQIVFDEISPGVHGVSVTRTSPLAAPVQADLLEVRFNVKQFPEAGEGAISVSNIRFADSGGSDIDFIPPADAAYTVEKTIVDLNLTTPGTITVTEGESFNATGEIFATGITIDDENIDSLNVWIGLNSSNTDPSSWSSDSWELMTYVDQTDSDYFTYTADIAFQRQVGTYYVALRGELLNTPGFSYGGVGGVWDETDNPSAQLEIQQQDQFQYTVAEWSFENDIYTPDRATYPNQTVEIELNGANLNGFTSGAANSNGWDSYSPGTNYWQIVINTEGLQDLTLSSDQSGGSSTGPRDFQIHYSTDGSSWIDLPGGTIVVGSETQESVDQLPLPAILEDLPSVFIRWVQTSDVRVDGDTDKEISSSGTSRIDDILITGQAINPTRVDVWPGDTNRDSVVDENDVMPLAMYWLSEGPPAIYPSIQFEAREVEQWIPSIVTDADGNGDGRVDQNDLQPVGLHFNETIPSGGMSGNQQPPIASLQLPALEVGETADVYVTTTEPVDLSGISLRIDIQGLDEEKWRIAEITPYDWGEAWDRENRLLEFETHRDGMFAAAIAHKGAVEPKSTTTLVRLKVTAEETWENPVNMRLLRSSVTADGRTTPLANAELTSETAVSTEPVVDERPIRTELLPNYPNPFNPVTTIPFTLSEAGAAQIEVFDAIGRKVASVAYDNRPAGSYTFRFDASALSSGMYMYRLRANGVVQTRKMMLLK